MCYTLKTNRKNIMSSSININGTEIKEKNGTFYINGKKVVNNCVDSFGIKASTFFAGFVCGVVFLIAIFEFGLAI
jgi:hypothetical protein